MEENITSFMDLMNHIIVVQDPIDLDKVVECRPIYIEPDGDFVFVYLQAVEPEYNDKFEPKLNTNIYAMREIHDIENNKNCYVKYND